ncbi:MAG TPA: hypothetical protein VHX13_00785 [Acidobacteriaceae bacterium]|jgi:hypothetical protein|nr:hypothetical protein [Acidobacteriaceae bacterium]
MASESTTRPVSLPTPRRVWFGVIASATAWFTVGIAEMLITWRACLHNEEFGNATSHPGATTASFVVSFFLLGLMAAAGWVSYSNWRRLSRQRSLMEAEGRGSHEFIALAGVFFSITLGAGMVWISLPLFILRLCVRVR